MSDEDDAAESRRFAADALRVLSEIADNPTVDPADLRRDLENTP